MSVTNRRQFLLAIPPFMLGFNALSTVATAKQAEAKKRQTLITISRETTRITEPLDEAGYPDYLAALNERYGQGATPQNNFMVEVCRVVGPKDMDETFRIDFFKKLGIEPLAADGDYLVEFEPFVAQELGADAPAGDKLFKLDVKSQEQPWRAKDNPLVARWLNRYDGHLTRIVEASQRTHCFAPLVLTYNEEGPVLIAVLLPTATYHHMLARALTSRAMLRLGERNVEGAWSDALAVHRIARHVGKGPTLIDALVAYAVDGIGWEATVAIAEHGKLSKQQIAKFRKDLRALGKISNVVEKIDKAERYMYLDCVCAVARSGPKLLKQVTSLTTGIDEGEANLDELRRHLANATVDWNEVLRMGNQYYDRMVANGRIKDAEKRAAENEKFDSDLKALAASVKKGLPGAPLLLLGGDEGRKLFSRQVGGIFISLLMPALGSVVDAQYRIETKMTLADLALTLAEYKLDRGQYPDAIDDLRPKYVQQVPTDEFSGAAFQYRRDGDNFLLYSIGVNRQDDGGRGPHDEPEGDDIVLRSGVGGPMQ